MGKGTNEPGEDTLGQTVHDVEGQTSKHTNTNDPLDGIIQKQIPGGGELALLEDQKLTLEKQKKRRERPPLLYCKLVTKWPLQTFLLMLAGHVMMIILSAGLLASGYDLLPVDFQYLPLELNNLPWRKRDLAWTYRDQYTDRYDRSGIAESYRSLSYDWANIDVYYDGKGGNILTEQSLTKIQSIEDRLTSVPEYSDYCQLAAGSSSTCQKPFSILRFFDGTYESIDPVFNDTGFNNIQSVLYAALTHPTTKSNFQYFLGKSYSITNVSAYSSITRSIFPLGYPIHGYTTTDDYESHVQEITMKYFAPILNDIRSSTVEFDFTYRSRLLWFGVVYKQAMLDVLCAVGSIVFIFCLILIHTKSIWITGFAVFSIMTCFLCTNLIYRVVLDFRYIGFFHVLTIFIVLGIGADDIFVFYDVWRNTGHEDYPTLAHRLSDAYRKSVFSMFFTSITTSVAFFASGISPLLATRSFGVFSGIVTIVNYLSVIIYLPTVVIMYHTKFEHFKWPCIASCKKQCKTTCKITGKDAVVNSSDNPMYSNNDSHSKPMSAANNTVLNAKLTHSITRIPNNSLVQPLPDLYDRKKSESPNENNYQNSKYTTKLTVTKDQNGVYRGNSNFADNAEYVDKEYGGKSINESQCKSQENTETKRYGKAKQHRKKPIFVRFFRDQYFRFVTHPVIRWIILAVMAIVLAFFIYQATRLEPDNEGLTILKADHVLRIAADHALYSFVESDAGKGVVIYIVWGMLERDLSQCHFSTPKCLGEQVWDSDFNPSTEQAQIAMKALCDKMLGFTTAETNAYHIRRDYITNKPQVSCYMHNLDTFLDAETASTGSNWSLTYDYNKVIAFMDNRTDFYNSSSLDSNYQHFIEVPISYWLSNKYTYPYTNDFYLFDHLIGEETGTYSAPVLNDTSRYYGNNIKYVGIKVNTTIKYQTLGYVEGIPIMNIWEDFVNSELANMPDGMKKGFQTTRWTWHWLLVQEALSTNAIYGIVIGVSLAFPILVAATRNLITGAFALLSMACSTVCVVGMITLGGWKLSALVSLNMCMVVGLTVDYVVHLAEGYTLSLHTDRLSRVRDMLDEMAVSVFMGACTTLGASLFMFIAQLSFFFQFGMFMFCTIGFSLFFSMGMFVTLMGLFGPQGDTGNIVVMLKNCIVGTRARKLIKKLLQHDGNLTSPRIWNLFYTQLNVKLQLHIQIKLYYMT